MSFEINVMFVDILQNHLAWGNFNAGEKVWRLPMEESYWELMKSPIADMKNTGARYGGAITAALFLKRYVDIEKVSLLLPVP